MQLIGTRTQQREIHDHRMNVNTGECAYLCALVPCELGVEFVELVDEGEPLRLFFCSLRRRRKAVVHRVPLLPLGKRQTEGKGTAIMSHKRPTTETSTATDIEPPPPVLTRQPYIVCHEEPPPKTIGLRMECEQGNLQHAWACNKFCRLLIP